MNFEDGSGNIIELGESLKFNLLPLSVKVSTERNNKAWKNYESKNIMLKLRQQRPTPML